MASSFETPHESAPPSIHLQLEESDEFMLLSFLDQGLECQIQRLPFSLPRRWRIQDGIDWTNSSPMPWCARLVKARQRDCNSVTCSYSIFGGALLLSNRESRGT